MATAGATLPSADLLPVSRRANIPYRLVRLIGVPLLRLCFRFDVQGRENIPRSGNYVVIANHLNWLDEFTLLYLFPVEPRLHFLADPTLLVTRKFQWWLVRTTGGYVPVVPVALSGTKDLWFRKTIKVVIGKPLPSVGADPAALTDLAFQQMRQMLPAYVEPAGRKLLRKQLTHLF